MRKISIQHLRNDHNDWLRALAFYEQEISILRGRLTEIAGKNTNKDVLQQVEHFENQFTVQLQNMDILKHDTRPNISEIARQAKADGSIDDAVFIRHEDLRTRFYVEEKIIYELRHDFNRFASEWM